MPQAGIGPGRPALLIALACVAAHGMVLFNGFTHDDDHVIVGVPFIQSLGNVSGLFSQDYFGQAAEESFRPVVTLTYMVDWAIWGARPVGFHLTNLLLHLATAIAVLLLVRDFGKRPGLALICALLFSVHPIHVETVSAVGFREDLLAALAVLLGLWCWHRVCNAESRFALWLLAALGAFALGALSKETGLVFPLLAVAVLLFSNGRMPRQRGILVIGSLIAVWVALLAVRFVWMANPSAVSGPELDLSGGRLAAFFVSLLGHSLRMCVIPYPMTPSQDAVPLMAGANAHFLVGLAALVAIAVWAWVGWRRPLALLALTLFAIPLLPVSNAVPLTHPIADRFLYLPSMGVCLAAALMIARLWPARPRAAATLLTAVLVIAVAVSAVGTSHWRSNLTLWSHAVAVDPENAEAHANLAAALLADGRTQEAEAEALRAVVLDETNAVAQIALGTALQQQGRYVEALAVWDVLVTRPPVRPDLAAALWNNRGLTLEALGDPEGAVDALARAVRVDPGFIDAHINLGALLAQRGMISQARECWRRTLEIDPESEEARRNLDLSGGL